jgi:hypothetical protein
MRPDLFPTAAGFVFYCCLKPGWRMNMNISFPISNSIEGRERGQETGKWKPLEGYSPLPCPVAVQFSSLLLHRKLSSLRSEQCCTNA